MCPRLPSSDSAHRLTQGELSALPYVLRDVVGRAVLIGGGIYVIFIGGLMYMGLGIYQNTKRTAAAVEKLAGH